MDAKDVAKPNALGALGFLLEIGRAYDQCEEFNDKKNYTKNFASHVEFRIANMDGMVTWEDIKEGIRKRWSRNKKNNTTISQGSLGMPVEWRSYQTATFHFAPYSPRMQNLKRWVVHIKVGKERHGYYMDRKFLGLTPLHDGEHDEASCEIIAVHDFGGHAFDSFKHPGSEEHAMWLRDHLARDGDLNARVSTYGYDHESLKGDSREEISDIVEDFRRKLFNMTAICDAQPKPKLILLGHGLGGIIIKEALLSLAANDWEPVVETLNRVGGVLFFGTPCRGMNRELVFPSIDQSQRKFYLKDIDTKNSCLKDPKNDFDRLFKRSKFTTHWFYETKGIPMAELDDDGKPKLVGPEKLLVEPFSATNGKPDDDGSRHRVHPFNCNHFDLVRFDGPDDPRYQEVRSVILELARSNADN